MTDPTASQPTLDTAPIEHLLQVLVKGLRAIQLYLPNNPVFQRAVANIRAAFDTVWEEWDELELQVGETDLLCEDIVVLSQPNKSESLAWILFKDGVRRLVFHRGVEEDEILQFLQVMHKARNLTADAPDDLLTLLWDGDFQYLKYDFIEVGMDEVEPLVPAEEPATAPGSVAATVQTDAAEAETAPGARGAPGIVSIEDFDSTLYFLDDEEIAYLKAEVEREYKQDLRSNVLSMLFDLLELQSYSTVRAELISIVENFIPYLLAVGDFRSVAYMLRETRVVLKRARELLPEHRQSLEGLPGRLSEPETLSQLLQVLDEALVHPTEEELSELFRELRPTTLSTLLMWMPKLTNERVRSLLDAAGQRLAVAHPDQMVQALESDDDLVLIETIRLAGQLKLPPVVPGLGRLVTADNPDVRRTAVEALAAIASPGAMKQLERAVDDADRDVRIQAVRAMAARGHRGAFEKIGKAVFGKALKDADLTEKTVFFEAYGMLAGEAGIEELRSLLLPGGFMRRKKDPQIRACAAMALGRLGTPEANAVLREAAEDKDPLVRNAVNKALRELG